MNLVRGAPGDALGLAVFAVWLAGLAALPWVRFLALDATGLTYRNWFAVRSLPWERVERFDIRRLLQRGGGGWVVVAHRRGAPRVTLRATGRGGSYRYGIAGAGGRYVVALAARLEDIRRRLG